MLQHVLFDLDGTLTDPALGITNSIMYAMPRFGLTPPADRRELYHFIGPPLRDNMMETFGLSLEDGERMLAAYREYFSVKGLFENELYEGIPQLLKTLCEHGIRVHLATSKPEKYARQIVEHFGLLPYFTFVGAADMEGRMHTKRDVIAHVLTNVPDITPENTAMVGDRDVDITGAHAFGLRAVGCAYGYAAPGELEAQNPDHIVDTVAQLQELLISLADLI